LKESALSNLLNHKEMEGKQKQYLISLKAEDIDPRWVMEAALKETVPSFVNQVGRENREGRYSLIVLPRCASSLLDPNQALEISASQPPSPEAVQNWLERSPGARKFVLSQTLRKLSGLSDAEKRAMDQSEHGILPIWQRGR
jgi:hypothetical protein